MKLNDTTRRALRELSFAALLVAGLAGCGGGGGGDQAPTQATPDNRPSEQARQSIDGFVRYVATLAGTADEQATVIDLSDYSLPVGDADSGSPVTTPNDDPASKTS